MYGSARQFASGRHRRPQRRVLAAVLPARRRVAVIEADVLPQLSVDNGEALLGEYIRIAGRQFTVIGGLAQKGNTGFGDNDLQILIPFETGRFEVFGTDRIQDIWALASSEELDRRASALDPIEALRYE